MIIKKVAIGNSNEAFVENKFTNGLNIISSDDNNKGKTIVLQSMMYSLGNEPTFPKTFEYKDYYHYVEFEFDKTLYALCRYNNSFVFKSQNHLMLFDNVSELKRYWTKNIFELPVFMKNEFSKIVDPVLFLQLFFVGQDKKDTSNIANHGLYNKKDFYEMIFAYFKISGTELDTDEINIIKNTIQQLKDERTILLQQFKILKSKKIGVSYLSSANDRFEFGQKVSDVEKINSKIAELRKSRNIALTRKTKWQTTIKELNSLNRAIDVGELRCMDCNSTNISFSSDKKATYTFDISTTQMRNEIIQSIQEKIESYNEEVERVTIQINNEQEKLSALLKDDSITIESIVAYKKEVYSAQDAENQINVIDGKIAELKTKLAANDYKCENNREKQEEILRSLVQFMNIFYKEIDANGNLIFDDLFARRDEIYSGSESTVFHIVKMLAIQKVLNHTFPIIIDSFRAEDLSTTKEKIVLNQFSQLSNQKIFTTTLKNEEVGKYKNIDGINNIDYQNHQPSKILQPIFVEELKMLLLNLSIEI